MKGCFPVRLPPRQHLWCSSQWTANVTASLSLLITPHNAFPPIMSYHCYCGFFYFSFSPSQLPACIKVSRMLFRYKVSLKNVFFFKKPTVEILKQSNSPPRSLLPPASRRPHMSLLSETEACSRFHFIQLWFHLNLPRVFTLDVPLLRDN